MLSQNTEHGAMVHSFWLIVDYEGNDNTITTNASQVATIATANNWSWKMKRELS